MTDKYKLLSGEELIKHSEAIELCIKTLDDALSCVVCLDGGKDSVLEFLKNEIYNLLTSKKLEDYLEELGQERIIHPQGIK